MIIQTKMHKVFSFIFGSIFLHLLVGPCLAQELPFSTFDFSRENDQVIIDVDLLEDDKMDVSIVTKKYVNQKISLRSKNKKLKLVSLEVIDKEEGKFQLIYNGNYIQAIKNELLFDLYPDIVNRHQFDFGMGNRYFETNIEKPTYSLGRGGMGRGFRGILRIGLFFVMAIFGFGFLGRRKAVRRK